MSGVVQKNFLPACLEQDQPMALGRFLIYANHHLARQCNSVRSDVQVLSTLQRWRRRA